MNSLRSVACLAAILVTAPALASKDPALEKPINTLVQSIKQQRYALALKQFAADEQGKRLVGEAEWAKATDAQRKEFTDLFQKLFEALGFPKLYQNFQYLDAANVKSTDVSGAKGSAETVILINHPLKKQELNVKFELLKVAGAWKVVDAGVKGAGLDSMLNSIRDDNNLPDLVKKGGIESLLKVMRDRLKEVQAQSQK